MRTKSEKRFLTTKAPGIKAEVYLLPQKNGRVQIHGHAVDADSLVRVDGSREYTRTAPSSNQEVIKIYINQIVHSIQQEQKKKSPSNTPASETGVYTSRYRDYGNSRGLCKPDWADSTARAAITYFERVLRHMDAYGLELSQLDMADIKDILVEHATQNGRSSKNRVSAENNVNQKLYRANYMYKRLQEHYPELPDVEFSLSMKLTTSNEQSKAIPDKVRVKLAYLLNRLAPINGLAVGVAAMQYMGVRTAEAAALKLGDIGIRERYVVCPILRQFRNGAAVPELKTEAAYRIAVGPYIFRELVVARMKYLMSQGYTEDEIQDMPAVSGPEDPKAYAGANALAAFGKAVLIACGYQEDALAAAKALQITEPDRDDWGNAGNEVVCYILRRDFCSRACNICGMRADDVDYLLGHMRERKATKDYTSEQVQQELASQLERYVFLPEVTLNPAFRALELEVSKTADIEGYSTYMIRNAHNTPMKLTIAVHTREPGESIRLVAMRTPESIRYTRGKLDSPEQRECRLIISFPKNYNYYETLTAEANLIDLTPFLPMCERSGLK